MKKGKKYLVKDFTAFLQLAGIKEPERIESGNSILNRILEELVEHAKQEAREEVLKEIEKICSDSFTGCACGLHGYEYNKFDKEFDKLKTKHEKE